MATKRKPPPKKVKPLTEKEKKALVDGYIMRSAEASAKKQRKRHEKKIEEAAMRWYAISRGRLEEIFQVTSSMASRIQKDPSCRLAQIFDADELSSFAGHLGDTISYLQNVAPYVGERIPNPVKVMGRE